MFTLVKNLYRGPNFKSIIPPCSQLKSYLYAIELTWFSNQCDSSANTIIETFFFQSNPKQGSQSNFFYIPGTGKAIFCWFLFFGFFFGSTAVQEINSITIRVGF